MVDENKMPPLPEGAVEKEMPPLPEGAVEKEMPPLPPGATEVEAPKEPTATEKRALLRRQQMQEAREDMKGFASGVAQRPVGIAQLAVTPAENTEYGSKISKYLQDTAKTLKEYGTERGQTAGKIGFDIAATGGILGAARNLAPVAAARLIPETIAPLVGGASKVAPEVAEAATAATEGTELATKVTNLDRTLKGLWQLTTEAAKGTAIGAPVGAATGAIETRTEDTAKERMDARWQEIENQFVQTGLFGGAVGALKPLFLGAGKLFSNLSGAEQRKALKEAEDWLASIKEKTGVKVSELKGEQEATATKAQSMAASAESEAQKIVEDFKNLPAEDKTSFGTYLKDRLAKNKTFLEAERERLSGFKEAVQSAPKGDVVKTDAIADYIKENQAKYNPETPTYKMFEHIKKALGLPSEEAVTTAKQGAKKLMEAREGISVNDADSLRKYWNTIEAENNYKALTNVDAAAGDEAHELGKIKELLMEAVGDAHKPYQEAVTKWAQESRPLDPYRTGGFKGLGPKDRFTGEYAVLESKLTGAVLKAAREGDPAFVNMVKNDPEFKEYAKKYFTGELFGISEAQKTPTATNFRTFWRNNEKMLDELGLKSHFKDLQAKFEKGEIYKQTAKEKITEMTEAKKLQDSLAQMQTKIENTPVEKIIKSEKMQSWVDSLRSDKLISDAEHDAMLKEINAAQRRYAETKNDKEYSDWVRQWITYTAPVALGLGAGANYVSGRIMRGSQ